MLWLHDAIGVVQNEEFFEEGVAPMNQKHNTEARSGLSVEDASLIREWKIIKESPTHNKELGEAIQDKEILYPVKIDCECSAGEQIGQSAPRTQPPATGRDIKGYTIRRAWSLCDSRLASLVLSDKNQWFIRTYHGTVVVW